MNTFRIDHIIKEQFIGKKLVALEFNANEPYEGSRKAEFGQVIKHAYVDCYDDNDVVIHLVMDDGSRTWVYDNEMVTLED